MGLIMAMKLSNNTPFKCQDLMLLVSKLELCECQFMSNHAINLPMYFSFVLLPYHDIARPHQCHLSSHNALGNHNRPPNRSHKNYSTICCLSARHHWYLSSLYILVHEMSASCSYDCRQCVFEIKPAKRVISSNHTLKMQ